jgi:membrane associated rhomboid family serine protease
MTLSLDGVLGHGRWHTLVTHMFAHGSIYHLAMNMFGVSVRVIDEHLTTGSFAQLMMFVRPAVQLMGNGGFASLYLFGGVVGGLFQLFASQFVAHRLPEREEAVRKQASVGASGGVFSVVYYAILTNPAAQLWVFFVVPAPAWLVGIGLAGYTAMHFFDSETRIGHASHLGGAFFGTLMYAITRGRLR